MKNIINTKPQIRVCLFAPTFYPCIGGNQTQTLLLAKALLQLGVRVIVLTCKWGKTWKTNDTYENIPIYRINIFSKYISTIQEKNGFKNKYVRFFVRALNRLTQRFFIYKAFVRYRDLYDIIHTQKITDSDICIKIAHKYNKKVLIKDATFNGLAKTPIKKRNYIYKYGIFAAVSSVIADIMRINGVDNNRIFEIPNGIDIANIYNKSNLSANKNTLLFVGNFWQGEIKGLDILLKALSIVIKSHPDVILSIAGLGNTNQYISLSKSLNIYNNVKFLGQVKDVDILYRTHYIYILPSRSEGMSNALLEAMSYGMPCIATNVSGVQEQIDNKKDGVIVPIEDYNAMANSICYMLENVDAAIKMGQNAKQKIKDKFDINIIANSYIEVYKKLL